MRLLKPKFTSIGSLAIEDFEKYGAVAILAYSSEKNTQPGDNFVMEENSFSTIALDRIALDQKSIERDWPKFVAKSGEILEIPVSNSGKISRLYLVGVGTGDREEFRKAGAALGRKVKGNGSSILLTLLADKKSSPENEAHIAAFATALSVSQYGFEIKSSRNKSTKNEKKIANTFIFSKSFDAVIKNAEIVADAVWDARDLIHTPSNIKNPAWLASEAKAMVSASKNPALTIRVKSGRALAQFGGLCAVGNSSPLPGPRLIELSYAPTGSRGWQHIVLVGKGITFDTGGISLKRPYNKMIPMKSDMAGVAAIMVTMTAIAKIKPRIRVTALLMCAENMISASSQRPSDVITHYGGTTVEVINTDAEGRLVLADGLAYADLELNPDIIVDIATLTGSASLGLGKQYAAMYSRDSVLLKKLAEIGEISGDRVWPMPLIDDYASALESDIADLNHTADKGDFSAGSVTAALFLEKFVGKRRWVHLDIAGPARSEKDAGEFIKGGTGFGVRLLIQWLASYQ